MCDDLKYEINDSGNDVIITGYDGVATESTF